MWFSGSKDIPFYELHNLKHVKTNAVWQKPVVPHGVSLTVDPLLFIYASTRASMLGKRIGLRGQLAGLGLGSVALCYLAPLMSRGVKLPSNKVFLHHNFDNTKDFIGSSIKGTIGASLAYLEMQRLGYAWSGHWEDCVSAAGTSANATPDFVFASATEVCLVDAKGSARPFPDVGTLARNEWKRQLYSNRNEKLKLGGMPTEGRIIAASLVRPRAVGLVAAYGRFRSPRSLVTAPGAPVSPHSLAIKSVQKINFTNAFYLLGLNALASQLINGNGNGNGAGAQRQLVWALAQTEVIDGQGAVFKGPSRVVNLGGGETWIMQPFCRAGILREAFLYLDSEDAPPVSSAALILPTNMEKARGLVGGAIRSAERVIVQSHDGVGAIFERVNII